jgi:dynein light chain Tctex-type 1
MDDLQTSDEVTFIPESVEPVCYEVIEAVLKDKIYNDMFVQGWIDDICSRITKELIETNKPFKYAGCQLFLFSVAIFAYHSYV